MISREELVAWEKMRIDLHRVLTIGEELFRKFNEVLLQEERPRAKFERKMRALRIAADEKQLRESIARRRG